MTDKLLEAILEPYGGDNRYIEHTLKVYGYCMALGEAQGLSGADMEILAAGAMLHDVGIPEARRVYGTGDGPYQELTGEKIAREVMNALNPAICERVATMVGRHHSFGYGDDPLLQVLFEADALVNIFEGRRAPTKEEQDIVCSKLGRKILAAMTAARARRDAQ